MLTDTLIQQLFASYPSHLGTIAADYKEIQEGFSGAKVLLVDVLGSDGAYSGKAYAKIDRSERTTAEFRQHAQARQGMEDHIPAVIHAPMGPVDGFSMVLYQPASEVVWGARSLSRVLDDFAANRLRWDEVAPQIHRLTNEVLAGWQIPKRLTTGRKGYAPRQLLQDVLNRGNDNRFDTLAERFKTHFGIQTTTSMLTFLADVTPPNNAITLPNPLYFALQDGLLPQLTLARTPMHGDLHGGNIICRLGQDGRLADVPPQILDTALFEPQGLLFFDLAYLELNVMARCLTVKDAADWADWLAILPALTRFNIRLKGEPPGMRPAATWPLLKAIRDRVAGLLEVLEKRSASVAEEYQASWWLAAWAAGLSISRSSHSQPWLRSAALLYAAYSLESLLRMWDIPLGGTPQPLRWDPERLELRAGESSAPLPVAPKALGRLWEVPSVSEGYLQRLDELNMARGLLLAHATTAVTAVGRDNRVAIQGMGGLGKTVLAAMLCRDEAVRMAFPDGIFWLTFGMQPQIESLMARLASYVEGRATALSDVESLRTLLVTLLGDKRCLLVLDDIWDHQHVRGLLGLGPQVRVLVTTRKQDVVRAVDAAIHTLQMLNNEDARLLLAKSSGVTLEKLPKATAGILKACNGLPLALDMIGRALKGKLLNRWDTMLNRLQNEELPDIPIQSADYNKGYNNLWTVVHVSVAELQEDMGEAVEGCYLDLAVFPDDAQVPEATLVTYWAARGLNVEDVQDLLDSLVDRALLLRETRDETLSLYKPHDLQLDYMRGRVKQSGQGPTALHERLLRAYNPENRPWHQVPDDHYLYLRLAYHLQELGRMDELHRLAVGSPEWRNAKFRACEGDAAYADDLLMLLGRYKDRHPPTADEMLRIAELRAAQQVIAARADRYRDLDLRLLVWFGRLGEALSYAHMRRSSVEKFKGLLAVRTALLENPRGQNPSQTAALQRVTDELLDSLRDDYGTEFLKDAQTFLMALVREGQHELARAGADSMRAPKARAGAWTQIGSMLTKLGSSAAEQAWECGLAAAHTLRFADERDWALSAIAEARAQAGQYEAAEGIARRIDQADERASALMAIAEARAQAGQYEASQVVFSEAEDIARGIESADERAWALRAIAEARAKTGQYEAAEGIARGIESAYERVWALSAIAEAQAQAGQYEASQAMLSEAEGIAREMERAYERARALRAIAEARAKTGQYEAAEGIARGIEETGARAMALMAIAEARAKTGQYEAAEGIARGIEESDMRAWALMAIAEARTQAGQYEPAEGIARGIERADARAWALSAIAEARAQAGQVEASQAVFSEAEGIARGIERAYERARALMAIAEAQAGQYEASQAVFSEAESIARGIEETVARAMALMAIAEARAKTGQYEASQAVFSEVEGIARGIESAYERASALSAIAEARAKTGQYEAAEGIARGIDQADARASALRAIAEARAQTGQYEASQAVF
ncbi:MAG TPA: NB-ARC domain-containing protein, partial [Aggregatilineales bacterium]|nr:NB-ARC domain-containing protein [Aggregatilineales bacterium]